MKLVTPKVYIIAKTQVQHAAVGQWLTDMGVTYDFNSDSPDVSEQNIWVRHNYPHVAHDGALLTTLAGKRCYMSFQVGAHNRNLTKVRNDMGEFIDNILKTGHGSVTEHTNYTFAIEGVSRVFTAEFNRHRAGMAVSEGSGRFISTDELTAVMPLEFEPSEGDSYEVIKKKERSRGLVSAAYTASEHYAKELRKVWADELSSGNFSIRKKLTSAIRSVSPLRTATGGVWTGNLRALRHVFTMRCDPAAESEICHVATLMLEMMMQSEPELFADFEKIDGYYRPRYRKV